MRTLSEAQKDLLQSYNLVAEDYAEHFRDELGKKPFDRRMLDWLIDKVGGLGMICDMGCGPGQVARYIYDRGARACGVDLSPAMIAQARKLHPTPIEFSTGDMLALNQVVDGAYGGIAAFYSIVNIQPSSLAQALGELYRVLRSGGALLLSYHIGEEVKHLDEWWGKKVSVDFYLYRTAEVKQGLCEAGFAIEEVIEREPYPEIEYQSRRAYIFAKKK
jgi:ubiquinone/menaquinone biosynthesis C-methylase UbiE